MIHGGDGQCIDHNLNGAHVILLPTLEDAPVVRDGLVSRISNEC